LIFWKIIKTVANGCHVLRLKCTKFNFDWSSASDATGGAYGSFSDQLAGFQVSCFKLKTLERRERNGKRMGREGEGREEREERRKERREG